MEKYCSATRDRLEKQINTASHELYKLKEERYHCHRLNVEVNTKNIVLECEDYKFAYGDDYTYCPDHSYDDCGCEKQHMAFIGYKAQNGLAHGYYPVLTNSCKEYKGMDRYKMFLIFIAKTLNFIAFREDIKADDIG